MSFFPRSKKAEVKKKKWQLDDSESDSEKVGRSEEDRTLECVICGCESEFFCIECNKYFCCDHFTVSHPVHEELFVRKDSVLSRHRCRLLIGVEPAILEKLTVGWLENEELTRFEQVSRRIVLKRQREQEDQEEKEKKKNQADLAGSSSASQSTEPVYSPAAVIHEVEGTAPKATTLVTTETIALENAGMLLPVTDLPVGVSAVVPVGEGSRFIFVSNINFEATLTDIRALFRKAGRIVAIITPKAVKTNVGLPHPAHHGLAQLEFDTAAGAQWALSMNGQLLSGRPIRVTSVTPETPNPAALRATPFKVRMCQHHLKGTCRRGDECHFAHHPRELPGGGADVQIPKHLLARGGVDGGFKW